MPIVNIRCLSVGWVQHLMVDYVLPYEIRLHTIPVNLIKAGLMLLTVLSAEGYRYMFTFRCQGN